MTPLWLAGSGLACALGDSLAQALPRLGQFPAPAPVRSLPGEPPLQVPYRAIDHAAPATCAADWYARAEALVRRVAQEAGAAQARDGLLLLASSSLDIGAVECGGATLDYAGFAARVAGWLDWRGPVQLVSSACTSSLNALLAAQALLQAGEHSEALVLGLELDNRLTLGGFAALQLLSPGVCQPLGAARDGLLLGEAVAALRLSTRARGAWALRGGACVVDGSQPTGASATACARMLRQALAHSGLHTADIDLIKLQAAGSPGNDAAEAEGLRAVFASPPPLVSLKAALGHTLGASGAAELALLCAALSQGHWPATDYAFDPALGCTLAGAAPPDVRRLLATILGFGGSHACVVLERA